MKKELFTFTGTAGNSLSAVIWLPEKTPKLLFQITHGMTEHMGRYEKLAEKLKVRMPRIMESAELKTPRTKGSPQNGTFSVMLT